MLLYLLDTNILAEPLRPKPHAGVLDALQRYEGQCAIPAVVWHELWFGCKRLAPSAKRQTIESYLAGVVAPTMPILPYDLSAALWHAEERARLVALGRTPPFADGMIAAVAVTQDLTLVTRNVDDFRLFQGMRCENWHDNA